MALRKRAPEAVPGGVPAELRTRLDPVWMSERDSRSWCELHGISPYGSLRTGPLGRFMAAAEGWLIAQGFTRTYGDNPLPFPDWNRADGIPLFACALEGDEEHFDYVLTDADWDWIAATERRHLARAAS